MIRKCILTILRSTNIRLGIADVDAFHAVVGRIGDLLLMPVCADRCHHGGE